jgi:hypothetical protein
VYRKACKERDAFYDYNNVLGSYGATQWFREDIGYLLQVLFCIFFFLYIFSLFIGKGRGFRVSAANSLRLHIYIFIQFHNYKIGNYHIYNESLNKFCTNS